MEILLFLPHHLQIVWFQLLCLITALYIYIVWIYYINMFHHVFSDLPFELLRFYTSFPRIWPSSWLLKPWKVQDEISRRKDMLLCTFGNHQYLPEVWHSPWKKGGWKTTFLLGRQLFRGYVKLRGVAIGMMYDTSHEALYSLSHPSK